MLKPQKAGKGGQTIIYDMHEGTQKELDLESSEDEWSVESDSSCTKGESSEGESEMSSLDVMGIVLRDPTEVAKPVVPTSCEEEEKLGKMLSKSLSPEERSEYMRMLKRHPTLFISDYSQITSVSVLQHHINLKPRNKPVARKLNSLV